MPCYAVAVTSQHSLTPEWVLWALSFAAAAGTAAFFYYLSEKNRHGALWSGYGTAVVALLVVAIFIRNDWVKREAADNSSAEPTPNVQSSPTLMSNAARPISERPKPSASTEPEPHAPDEGVPRQPTQTIINSPGAIQAGRDVTIVADPQLIRSIEMRLSVEAPTAAKEPGPENYDLGLGSIIALFTRDKQRYRFASDMKLYDQQVTENRRRLRFVYQPEDPPQILGRPIALLGTFDVLAVNFAEVFDTVKFETSAGEAVLELGVIVNGLPIARVIVNTPTGTLNKGQANMNIRDGFSRIPDAYAAAINRK